MRRWVVLLVLLISACSGSGGIDEKAQQSLQDAEALWAQQNLSDYAYQAHWNCYCVEATVAPVTVVVEDNVVVSVRFVDPNQEGEVPSPQRWRPIEGMFAYIQEAIDDQPDELEARYDATLGYPTYFYTNQDDDVEDGGYGFSIDSLVVSD